MAININRSFINNTGLNENNCLNSLFDNVSPEYCTDIDFQ